MMNGVFTKLQLRTRSRLGSLLSLLAVGCVPEFEDDLSRVERSRIVAIRTSPAEAREGESVSIEALVLTPLNASVDAGAPQPRYQFCLDRKPLTELGSISETCITPGGSSPTSVLSLGTGSHVVATVPSDACRLFGPRRPEPKPGEPSGRPVDPDPSGGFYQPIVAWLDSAEDTADRSTRSVDPRSVLGAVRLNCGLAGAAPAQQREFASRYRENENPEFSRIELVHDDGSVEPISFDPELLEAGGATLRAGERAELRAVFSSCPVVSECGDDVCGAWEDAANCSADCAAPKGCTGSEAYAYYDRDAQRVLERRESLSVSWFATGGSFSSQRTDTAVDATGREGSRVGFQAPAEIDRVRVWAVIHDERGGVGHQTFDLTVGAP